ncbi:MAG: hypothetical protein J6W33_05530, partial [Spirochaetia bacterium]|nr:hypothetical protein [Spirochaetia bacterium]
MGGNILVFPADNCVCCTGHSCSLFTFIVISAPILTILFVYAIFSEHNITEFILGGLLAEKELRINEGIRVREVRLLDENGEQKGVVSIQEALTLAQERGYDLVEVAPQANP